MLRPITHRQPITLLKTSFDVLVAHPVILAPLIIAAFIHFFILEILYFVPRFPLSLIFAPWIRQTAGEAFLHYPYNFILMSNWYYALQVPLYVLFNSYFLSVSVVIIQAINNDQAINLESIYKNVLSRYLHIFLAAFLSVGALMACNQAYVSLAQEVLVIPFTGGMGGWLKEFVINGSSYLGLLLAVFVTTLFAFVIPLIVLEGRGIWSALKENFRILRGSFGFIFFVIFLPYLLYVPFLLLRMNAGVLDLLRIPDLMVFALALAVCVMLLVEAIQYTAITLYFLLKKENR